MKNVTVRIETGSCKDTLSRKAVTLMFVPEEHAHLTEREGMVKFSREMLPNHVQHVVPRLTYTATMAKMANGKETKVECFKSFLTEMKDGVFIIAIRSEVWELYKHYIQENIKGVKLMAARSIVSLLLYIETQLCKLEAI